MAKKNLTYKDLNQTYGDGVVTGILAPASERNADGTLTDAVVKERVQFLKQTGVIPTRTDVTVYQEKQKRFLEHVKAEYDFYKIRYKDALNKVLSAVTKLPDDKKPSVLPLADDSSPLESKKDVDKMIAVAVSLNQKMSDLSQYIQGITNDMKQSSSQLHDEIKAFNQVVKDKQSKLEHQQKMIATGDASAKLRKEMLRYAEEKARYSDNLLKLYTFLNIVSIGLLIYVYRASAD
jgi:hypothetical protein